ncbi:unnamed protein product [Gordionus sp. m RMFG-2023]|uniref:gastrula zinc finger protein XlCGF44.2-like n=1 Tax=Gordionus sp. m RMFG-2023 TaxID=3053472 RepID=UPI0030E1D28B
MIQNELDVEDNSSNEEFSDVCKMYNKILENISAKDLFTFLSGKSKSNTQKLFKECNISDLKQEVIRENNNVATFKKFECTICNKYYTSKGILNTHITQVHLKVRPYPCNMCQKSFSQKGNLREHISTIHEKVRPHECVSCGKNFTQKGNLKEHMLKVHHKLKPYPCIFCPKRFSQKANMEQHIRKIHPSTL